VANIVEKQAKDVTRGPVDQGRLKEDAERALHGHFDRARQAIDTAVKQGDYAAALGAMGQLKPSVDTFFDKVMVMDPDKAVRENRVRLLMDIGGLFSQVADFSRLQSEA
jgi:glycyl-tRNA synthetase beta chain